MAALLTLVMALAAGCGSLARAGHAAVPSPQTYCGWDGGGLCPSLGDGSRPASPRIVGSDREVVLTPFFTSDAVAAPGKAPQHDVLYGAAFPLRSFPSSGTLTLTVAGDRSVSFLIPPHEPGEPSAVSLSHQVTVSVPHGVYGALWLLEAGVGGNIGPLELGLRYADGDATVVPVTFGDWCNGGFPLRDAPPEYVGISLPEVLSTPAAMAASATAAAPPPPGTKGGHAALRLYRARCGLWAEEVPLPPLAAPLADVTLPAHASQRDPMAFVMAMTLQTGAPPPIPASSA